MRTVTLIAASLAVLGAANAVRAETPGYAFLPQGGVYGFADIGPNRADRAANDKAVTGDIGIGYEGPTGLRADFSLSLGSEIATPQKAMPAHVMLNGYYDLPVADMIAVYVGAGAGYGYLKADNNGANESGLAYAGMAGFDIGLTDTVTGSLGYRYRRTMLDGDDLTEQTVLAGLRMKF